MQRVVIVVVVVAVLTLAAQVVFAGSLSFYQVGNKSVAMFQNETGKDVIGLVLKFTAPVSPVNTIGIGANMTLTSDDGNTLMFEGTVVPGGVWEVDWNSTEVKLVSARWLTKDSKEEIDVHAPTVNIFIKGGMVDERITFSALGSQGPDGKGLVHYAWEWEDGTTAEGYEVSRVYHHWGIHKVTLTVTDKGGDIASKTAVFVIHEPPPPPVVLQPKPTWILVYSQDFSSDPGFTSTAPTDVYWDPEAGNYYALIRDVASGKGYYVGYSPEFKMVNGDFKMTFDFTILHPNWGNYPQIRALNTQIAEDPNDLRFRSGYYEPFYFAYVWADAAYKKFQLGSTRDNPYTFTRYVTDDKHPVAGVWYHVNISYNSDHKTADWTITRKDNSSLFYSAHNLPFPISAGFNRLYIGYITVPPKYGTTSDIRVDNINIEALINKH